MNELKRLWSDESGASDPEQVMLIAFFSAATTVAITSMVNDFTAYIEKVGNILSELP